MSITFEHNFLMTTFFDDGIGTESPPLIVAFKTGTQPGVYPFLRLYTIAKAHYFGITKDVIQWLAVFGMKASQKESFCCQPEHRLISMERRIEPMLRVNCIDCENAQRARLTMIKFSY